MEQAKTIRIDRVLVDWVAAKVHLVGNCSDPISRHC
jgi:hypothetical protein